MIIFTIGRCGIGHDLCNKRRGGAKDLEETEKPQFDEKAATTEEGWSQNEDWHSG